MSAYERALVTNETFQIPNFLQRNFGSPTEHFVSVFSSLLSRRRAIECWRGGKVRLIEFTASTRKFQMYSRLSCLLWTTSSDVSLLSSVKQIALFQHYLKHEGNLRRANLLQEKLFDFRSPNTVLQLAWGASARREFYYTLNPRPQNAHTHIIGCRVSERSKCSTEWR